MVAVAVVPSGKVTVTVLPGSDVPLTSTEPSGLVVTVVVGASGAVVSAAGEVSIVGLSLEDKAAAIPPPSNANAPNA